MVHAFGLLLGRTFSAWRRDNAMRLGAALAYYTVFSLTPFLIVVIAIAGLAVSPGAAEHQVVEQIARLVGPDGGRAVAALLAGARRQGAGLAATATSLVTIGLGATAVFTELQSGLNEIWHVQRPEVGVRGVLRARLRSAALVAGIGFLFLAALLLRTALAAVQTWLGGPLAMTHETLALFMTAAIFAMIFKVLPQTPVAWRDVAVGAFATAVFFTIGQIGLARYLATRGLDSIYGAAGSLVVVLVWVYYSAQVFFFGAEFTYVYASTYGSRAWDTRASDADVTPRESSGPDRS